MQTCSAKIYEINMPGELNILKYLMTGLFVENDFQFPQFLFTFCKKFFQTFIEGLAFITIC
jgi:hypothetical protein